MCTLLVQNGALWNNCLRHWRWVYFIHNFRGQVNHPSMQQLQQHWRYSTGKSLHCAVSRGIHGLRTSTSGGRTCTLIFGHLDCVNNSVQNTIFQPTHNTHKLLDFDMLSNMSYSIANYFFVQFLQDPSLQISAIFLCVIHYGDIIMGAIASQITSLAIVYSAFYSGAD